MIPGVNQVITPGGLVSPSTTEWTAGVGGSVGRRFTYRVDGVYRNYTDFYVTVKDTTTGQVVDPYVGDTYDLGYIANGKDPLVRKYYGLHTNLQWRPWDSLNIGASWTWSHTYGNTDTENVGSGPISIYNFDYPEYQNAAWSMPEGNLTQDQRHRVRAFGTWDIPFPKSLGHLSLGFLYSLGTGLPYGGFYHQHERHGQRGLPRHHSCQYDGLCHEPRLRHPAAERSLLLHRARRLPDRDVHAARPLAELRDQRRAGRDLRFAAGPQRLQRRHHHRQQL